MPKAAAGIFPKRWTEAEIKLGEVLAASALCTVSAPTSTSTTSTTLMSYIPFVPKLVDVNLGANTDDNLDKPKALYSGISNGNTSLGAE